MHLKIINYIKLARATLSYRLSKAFQSVTHKIQLVHYLRQNFGDTHG